jgi:hypothetical protein
MLHTKTVSATSDCGAEGTFERFAERSSLFLKPCFVHWIDSLFLVRALMLFRTLYRSDISKSCLVSQFHFARSLGHLLMRTKSVRDL